MPRAKKPSTKVRTGVTTGTAVAMLFLTASAAFAAAAFTKVPMKTPFLKSVIAPDLTFIVDKPGVAIFSDSTTLQLQAVYRNVGSVEAGKHQSSCYFMDKNKTALPVGRLDWGVDPIPPGGIKEVDVRVTNVPVEAVYIGLGVDTTNNVPESSEANNEMVIALARPSVAAQPGAIAMRLGDDTPISRIIVGGTNDVPMLKVRFIATGEAFTVKKLRIFNDNPEDDTGIAQIKLTYPTSSGATETKTGVFESGVMNFQGLNMYVPANADTSLIVSADLLQFTRVGISGDTPQFGIDYDSNFEAQGQSSGVVFTSVGSSDVVGNTMVVRKTKPTITLASSSPAGAGVPGLNEVLRFTVTADAASSLVFQKISFKVSSTDISGNGWNKNDSTIGKIAKTSAWSLYDAADSSTQLEGSDADWTLYGNGQADSTLSGSEVVGYAHLYLTNFITIPAGTSKNFILKVDATGASSQADDVVRFDILNEGGAGNMALRALDEFQWTETGAFVTPPINGIFVKNLPVIGGTIIY